MSPSVYELTIYRQTIQMTVIRKKRIHISNDRLGFKEVVSLRTLWAFLPSPCENREFVDRGLGGAEYVILRGGFSLEEGNSFSFAQISLLLFVKFAEFVFDKTVNLNSCSQNPHRLNMCLLQSISRDSHSPLGAYLGANGAGGQSSS